MKKSKTTEKVDVVCRNDGERSRITVLVPLTASAKACERMQKKFSRKLQVTKLSHNMRISHVVPTSTAEDVLENFAEAVRAGFKLAPNIVRQAA